MRTAKKLWFAVQTRYHGAEIDFLYVPITSVGPLRRAAPTTEVSLAGAGLRPGEAKAPSFRHAETHSDTRMLSRVMESRISGH
jgi:hypothetical protein